MSSIIYGCTSSKKIVEKGKESGWIWNGTTGKFDLILLTETGKVSFQETCSQPKEYQPEE